MIFWSVKYNLLICFLFIAMYGYTQRSNELKRIKEQKEKEIQITESLINETKNKKIESLNQLNIIEKKINIRNSYINQVNGEIEKIGRSINENSVLINTLNLDKSKLLKEYGKIIYNSYKFRQRENFLMYILASETISQAYKRIKYVQMYLLYKQKQRRMIDAYERVLRTKNEELSIQKSQNERILKEREEEKNRLAQEKDKKNKLVKSLQKKEKELLKELEEKKKTALRISNEIERIIEEERRKGKSKNIYENLTPFEKNLSNEFEKNRGKLPWPTEHGVITGHYGLQQHPVLKDVKVRNDGIYITTIKNEEAKVIFNGIVSKVFSLPGSNYTVIVKHGNYFSLYNNLVQIYVKEGDNVKTKQKIGRIFTDDSKNETILHFQVWKEKEKNDPELWLSK